MRSRGCTRPYVCASRVCAEHERTSSQQRPHAASGVGAAARVQQHGAKLARQAGAAVDHLVAPLPQGVEKGSAVGEKMPCDRGCSLQKI